MRKPLAEPNRQDGNAISSWGGGVMGKRGQKTQPTTLKILRGNPGKRALPKNEPQPAHGFPPCPEHLTPMAREAWKLFSVQLESAGVGTVLDATALELLCTSYALYRDAAEQVAKYGPCWVKANGDGAPSRRCCPIRYFSGAAMRMLPESAHRAAYGRL